MPKKYAKKIFKTKKQYKRQPIAKIVQNAVMRTAELKFKDTAISGVFTGLSEFVLLNGMDEGVTSSTRVGRKTMMHSIQINGYTASTTTSPVRHFIALVYDKEANGAAPAATDLYSTTITNGALRNLDDNLRFKILYSAFYKLDSRSVDTMGSKLFEIYKKVKLPVNYDLTTAGGIAGIQNGSLYLMFYSSATASEQTHVMNVRIRYTDV